MPQTSRPTAVFRLTAVLSVALAAAGIPSPAGAQPRGGATLYADDFYRGASETFRRDVPDLGDTRFGNDRASSLRLAPGCTALLYKDADFRGRVATLTRDEPRLEGTAVGNDSVSSLRIRCEDSGAPDWSSRPGVALYVDESYRGRREIFYADDSDLRNNRVGNDTVSSVHVAPGCRVTLFENSGYRGRSVELTDDTSSLGRTSLGSDRASSVRVDCRRKRRFARVPRPRDNPRPGSGGVTLFQNENFAGASETFYGDVRDLGRTRVGNDRVSSVRVAPGCQVVLYRDAGFAGRSAEIFRDTSSLRSTPVGDDAVSSLTVDCRRR